MVENVDNSPPASNEQSRRDFLLLSTSAAGVVGGAAALWPFIDSMNPAADTLALSTTEINISHIVEGQSITVVWRGSPVFIRHRTQREIDEARDVSFNDLKDPQKDADRAIKPEYLVMVGVCTHLGCIPGNKASDPKGDYDGWFCPCHGSHYDSSGRIRKGPAPKNLVIPPYKYLDDKTILIG
jgi:ubiquinol-cytochrome c reductase iron-sulfur subunit